MILPQWGILTVLLPLLTQGRVHQPRARIDLEDLLTNRLSSAFNQFLQTKGSKNPDTYSEKVAGGLRKLVMSLELNILTCKADQNADINNWQIDPLADLSVFEKLEPAGGSINLSPSVVKNIWKQMKCGKHGCSHKNKQYTQDIIDEELCLKNSTLPQCSKVTVGETRSVLKIKFKPNPKGFDNYEPFMPDKGGKIIPLISERPLKGLKGFPAHVPVDKKSYLRTVKYLAYCRKHPHKCVKNLRNIPYKRPKYCKKYKKLPECRMGAKRNYYYQTPDCYSYPFGQECAKLLYPGSALCARFNYLPVCIAPKLTPETKGNPFLVQLCNLNPTMPGCDTGNIVNSLTVEQRLPLILKICEQFGYLQPCIDLKEGKHCDQFPMLAFCQGVSGSTDDPGGTTEGTDTSDTSDSPDDAASSPAGSDSPDGAAGSTPAGSDSPDGSDAPSAGADEATTPAGDAASGGSDEPGGTDTTGASEAPGDASGNTPEGGATSPAGSDPSANGTDPAGNASAADGATTPAGSASSANGTDPAGNASAADGATTPAGDAASSSAAPADGAKADEKKDGTDKKEENKDDPEEKGAPKDGTDKKEENKDDPAEKGKPKDGADKKDGGTPEKRIMEEKKSLCLPGSKNKNCPSIFPPLYPVSPPCFHKSPCRGYGVSRECRQFPYLKKCRVREAPIHPIGLPEPFIYGKPWKVPKKPRKKHGKYYQQIQPPASSADGQSQELPEYGGVKGFRQPNTKDIQKPAGKDPYDSSERTGYGPDEFNNYDAHGPGDPGGYSFEDKNTGRRPPEIDSLESSAADHGQVYASDYLPNGKRGFTQREKKRPGEIGKDRYGPEGRDGYIQGKTPSPDGRVARYPSEKEVKSQSGKGLYEQDGIKPTHETSSGGYDGHTPKEKGEKYPVKNGQGKPSGYDLSKHSSDESDTYIPKKSNSAGFGNLGNSRESYDSEDVSREYATDGLKTRNPDRKHKLRKRKRKGKGKYLNVPGEYGPEGYDSREFGPGKFSGYLHDQSNSGESGPTMSSPKALVTKDKTEPTQAGQYDLDKNTEQAIEPKKTKVEENEKYSSEELDEHKPAGFDAGEFHPVGSGKHESAKGDADAFAPPMSSLEGSFLEEKGKYGDGGPHRYGKGKNRKLIPKQKGRFDVGEFDGYVPHGYSSGQYDPDGLGGYMPGQADSSEFHPSINNPDGYLPMENNKYDHGDPYGYGQQRKHKYRPKGKGRYTLDAPEEYIPPGYNAEDMGPGIPGIDEYGLGEFPPAEYDVWPPPFDYHNLPEKFFGKTKSEKSADLSRALEEDHPTSIDIEEKLEEKRIIESGKGDVGDVRSIPEQGVRDNNVGVWVGPKGIGDSPVSDEARGEQKGSKEEKSSKPSDYQFITPGPDGKLRIPTKGGWYELWYNPGKSEKDDWILVWNNKKMRREWKKKK